MLPCSGATGYKLKKHLPKGAMTQCTPKYVTDSKSGNFEEKIVRQKLQNYTLCWVLSPLNSRIGLVYTGSGDAAMFAVKYRS